MEMNDKDDLGKRNKLINTTSEVSDMEYQSQLAKRKSFDKNYEQKERERKLRIWKIVLLISLAVLLVVGIILVIVGVVHLKHSQYLENRQDTNMFEIVNVSSTINQAKIQLRIIDGLSKFSLNNDCLSFLNLVNYFISSSYLKFIILLIHRIDIFN